MSKSSEAFRTIGEVADELDVPKHVLRFWEARFPHIRPMKRGGGRRYYRPEDMELLRGIRHLLHAEGYTIKGVQKILREQGIDQVKAAAAAAGRAVKGRGRTPARSAGSVAVPADAPVQKSEAKSAPTASSASARSISDVETARSARDLKETIVAAIRELEMCRKLLVAATASPTSGQAREGARLKAARS
jgi:DNA-binding transcriptional MerR regulator